MNLSAPFIRRPVATSLLSVALLISGALAFKFLPVAALPQIEYPTIYVNAGLPGGSPETVASSIATPLERQFGRIAGLTEMTSHSSLGSTGIVLQFDLSRNVDAAARDVEAAINAARTELPQNLPMNPTYRKVNPSNAPVLIVALTSDTLPVQNIYDAADSIMAQKLAQVPGVGQVGVSGGAQPAVRIDAIPTELASFGLSLNDLQNALKNANANTPVGSIDSGEQNYVLNTNDQLFNADQYKQVIVAYRNGAAVRVGDVARVSDSVLDVRQFGVAAESNWDAPKRSVVLIIFTQPGANILETVDGVKKLLPQLVSSVSPEIHTSIMVDRTTSIRASVNDVERTLIIAVLLVILVVFVFLRNIWATIIPSVAVPLSLVATFGVMYLGGFSIDNLSLMALTVSTGFVVDDAIVVIENITRYLDMGMTPLAAALEGAGEIAFTVLSMSVSLIAVFIPILLMGGIVGRIFREFAVVLSSAVAVSLLVSLTTTPMMCAKFLKSENDRKHGRIYRASERGFNWLLNGYDRGLKWVLKHDWLMIMVTLATVCLSVYLYIIVPKGFFPQQDTGRLMVQTQGAQDVSFQEMSGKQMQATAIVLKDPAIDTLVSFTSGGSNYGTMFAGLKPKSETHVTSDQVINRLRPKLSHLVGLNVFMQSPQDLRSGARSSGAQYQYTLQDANLAELNEWAPKLQEAFKKLSTLRDVNTDAQMQGLSANVTIDRDTAARFGIQPSAVDSALGLAFGQSQVSTLYTQLNQYHAVLEVSPELQQSPAALSDVYVPASPAAGAATSANFLTNPATSTNTPPSNNPEGSSSGSSAGGSSTTGAASAPGTVQASSAVGLSSVGTAAATSTLLSTTPTMQVPLSAFTHYSPQNTSLGVNHQGQLPAITLSFNLAPGVSLSDAVKQINQTEADMQMPATIQAAFAGTAAAFTQSLKNEPILIFVALITVFIVLGVLYESWIHPITILSTLPSAGVGALLALLLFHADLDVIALIGIILLIGIVKKNAIMIVDFAITAERKDNLTPDEAIYRASLLRFRPIMMTTFAAMFGALPLALGSSMGSELRRPLGITIVGGLVVSQMLTLFTTPVIYLWMDRLRIWISREKPHAKRSPVEPIGESAGL